MNQQEVEAFKAFTARMGGTIAVDAQEEEADDDGSLVEGAVVSGATLG